MTENHTQNRALQQDARAWAKFTGCNYTSALRQMEDPLAQGFLGERISARKLIDTLEKHDLDGNEGDDFVLGEAGFYTDTAFSFNGKDDYIQLALIAEALEMFSRIPKTKSPEVSSYSLKDTVERFLKGTPAYYVTNGRLMWAAAALGLPIAEPDRGGSPNLLIGIPDNEHDYVRKMVINSGQSQPQAHHHRPPGYAHLRTALTQCAAGEPVAERWVRPTPAAEDPDPFHAWLIAQAGRDEPIGDFASDYAEGIRSSAHRIARNPDELVLLLNEIPHSPQAYDAAREVIGAWLGTLSPSPGIRTIEISDHTEEVGGFGAGAGTVERIEYRCPCGDGLIVEEHDNIPGFREHDVTINCPKCRDEWRLLDGRSVRDWALEPVL
ncbi:hypothetical protein [Arthrobacter flavus]|uniref:Uncharacterized protein n=1 Tax=Arthrobacter flavus TaxID=95172 RepID=A0ABW4Q328_9MICC